jgi:hypothetical protein
MDRGARREKVGQVVHGFVDVVDRAAEHLTLGCGIGWRIGGEIGCGQIEEGGLVGEQEKSLTGVAAGQLDLPAGETFGTDPFGEHKGGKLFGNMAVGLASGGEQDLLEFGDGDALEREGGGEASEQEQREKGESTHRGTSLEMGHYRGGRGRSGLLAPNRGLGIRGDRAWGCY